MFIRTYVRTYIHVHPFFISYEYTQELCKFAIYLCVYARTSVLTRKQVCMYTLIEARNVWYVLYGGCLCLRTDSWFGLFKTMCFEESTPFALFSVEHM